MEQFFSISSVTVVSDVGHLTFIVIWKFLACTNDLCVSEEVHCKSEVVPSWMGELFSRLSNSSLTVVVILENFTVLVNLLFPVDTTGIFVFKEVHSKFPVFLFHHQQLYQSGKT